jgi:hypothetical protein
MLHSCASQGIIKMHCMCGYTRGFILQPKECQRGEGCVPFGPAAYLTCGGSQPEVNVIRKCATGILAGVQNEVRVTYNVLGSGRRSTPTNAGRAASLRQDYTSEQHGCIPHRRKHIVTKR